MAQLLIGRELPNLKITLGIDGKSENDGENNDQEMDADISDGEIVDKESDSASEKSDKNVAVNVKWNKLPFKGTETRRYENKGGAFITGLDLTSDVVLKKLEVRAKRFGLEARPKHSITQAEIDALYKGLEIDTNQLEKSCKSKGIRLDSVYVRGVNDMSTEEVFEYFEEYGPSSVEWINDYSCNVVWLDKTSAARALLGLSRLLIVKPSKGKETNLNVQADKENQGVEEMDCGEEVVIMSEEESGDEAENEQISNDDISVENKMEVETDTDSKTNEPLEKIEESCDNEKNDKNNEDVKNKNAETAPIEESKVEIPVPRGCWRLGVQSSKAEALLMRFATKDDKKLPGAEKRSRYYQKYGNPNFGGLKGLISSSRKRQYIESKQKKTIEKIIGDNEKVVEEEEKPQSDNSDDHSRSQSPTREYSRDRSKKLRMRMYADDEENRRKKRMEAIKNQRKEVEPEIFQKDIKSRLGVSKNHETPYSESSSVSEADENSEEEKEEGEASASDRVSSDSDSYGNFEDSLKDDNRRRDEDKLMAADKEDGRASVWKRLTLDKSVRRRKSRSPPDTSYRMREEVDLRHKISTGSSSSNKQSYSKDGLRSVVHVAGDLRSKLQKLRKDREIKKHSPLLIQVRNDRDDSDSSDS